MRYKKIISLCSAIGLLAVFELFLIFYVQWYIIAPIGILWLIISIWLITVEKIFSKVFWMYVITPVLLMIAIFGMLAILENAIMQQILIIGGSLLYWLYSTNVAVFNFDFQHYHASAIENISSYMNLISLFCISIVAYAAEALLNFSLGIMGGFILIIFALVLMQSIWAAQIESPKKYLYVLAMVIMYIEGFWSIAFLPSNFYLQGFLLTIGYYGIWGLLKSNLLGIFSKRLFIRYLGVCSIAVLAVILSARWI